MGKKRFYTERDIEDLAAQGINSLTINDDVVLTELGREKAAKLGLSLVQEESPVDLPRPRPVNAASPAPPADLSAKVKATVLARMGPGVPEELLDAVIPRVLAELNLSD